MTAASDYLKVKLADHVLRGVPYTPPTTLYVSLHTANPTGTGLVAEISGNGYARSEIPASSLYWTNSSGVAANNILVSFPEATAPWDEISHFGLWDSLTNANLLVYGMLSAAKVVDEGSSLAFPVSFLTVTFS